MGECPLMLLFPGYCFFLNWCPRYFLLTSSELRTQLAIVLGPRLLAINAVAWRKIKHPGEINPDEATLVSCDRTGLHGSEPTRKTSRLAAGDLPEPCAGLGTLPHIPRLSLLQTILAPHSQVPDQMPWAAFGDTRPLFHLLCSEGCLLIWCLFPTEALCCESLDSMWTSLWIP